MQLISGLEHPVLDKSTRSTLLKWTPSCQIANFKDILTHIDGETNIENQCKPSLQHKKDIFLMEAFSSFTANSHDLKLLNNGRIYLKIITLSNITSADEKH